MGKRVEEQLSKLGDEENEELSKEWDSKQVLKNLDTKTKALDKLQSDVQESGRDQFEDCRARVKLAFQELSAAAETAEALFEAAKYLSDRIVKDVRKKGLANAYQKRKMAKTMTDNGTPKTFANAVAAAMFSEEQAVPTTDDVLHHTAVMYFNDSNETGQRVLAGIQEIQNAAASSVEEKVASLRGHIADSGRPGKMVQIPTANRQDLPCELLCTALGLQSYSVQFCDMAGNCGWLSGGKPWFLRDGPGSVPFAGCGSVYQLAGHAGCEPTPMTIYLFPIATIVQTGLTILGDLQAYLAQSAGALAADNSALCYTLTSSSEALFVPFGWWPCLITRDRAPQDYESQRASDQPELNDANGYLWCLALTSKQLLLEMDSCAWPPICKVNADYCQALLGHKIWADRNKLWDKLANERAWDTLNQTLKDDDTEENDGLAIDLETALPAASAKFKAKAKGSSSKGQGKPTCAAAEASGTIL